MMFFDSEEVPMKSKLMKKFVSYHKARNKFPAGTSEYDARVYESAAEHFDKFQKKVGQYKMIITLYYIYAQTMDGKLNMVQYGGNGSFGIEFALAVIAARSSRSWASLPSMPKLPQTSASIRWLLVPPVMSFSPPFFVAPSSTAAFSLRLAGRNP